MPATPPAADDIAHYRGAVENSQEKPCAKTEAERERECNGENGKDYTLLPVHRLNNAEGGRGVPGKEGRRLMS